MSDDIQERLEVEGEINSKAQIALDLARQLIQLEHRVDAYAKLYEEELADIREELKELSANLLSVISKTQGRKSMVHSSSHDDPGDSTQ